MNNINNKYYVNRNKIINLILYLFLFGLVIIIGYPFAYMIFGSFKENYQIFRSPVTLLAESYTDINYVRLLSGELIPFFKQFGNSIIISLMQVFFSLFIATTVGWGFAKFEFYGKKILLIFLIATLAIPFQITLIPLFQLTNSIGWLNTYHGVAIPASITAFGAVFMRQNMLSVPSELIDAARIDGASEWKIFYKIGLPLSKGAIAVLSLLVFLASWNDILWPLIVLRTPEMMTVPIGLANLSTLYKIEYGMILAGATLISIPVIIIFILGRKHILGNLTIGSIKG